MGQSGPLVAKDASPVRIELLVIDLMNLLLAAGPDGLDAALNQALQQIGLACGLDRAFLFLARPDGRHVNSHEWVAPGVEALLERSPSVEPGMNPTWRAEFEAGRIVAIEHVADMPTAMPERRFLEEIAVRASLMAPLCDGDRLLGVIGVDSQAPGGRVWSEGERFLLRSVGQALSSILLRHEASVAESVSRSHLEATLRALPDLVIEICPQGRIMACHSEKLPWLSGLVHSGIGQHVERVLPAPLAEKLKEMMRLPLDPESSRRRRVGVASLVAPHWYEISMARLPAGCRDGSAGFVVVIRDLTAEHAPSEMASYREGQFTAFFQMCPHPILLNDYDTGEILDGNRAFNRVFGVDPKNLAGTTIRDILPGDAAWVIEAAVSSIRQIGSYGPVEAVLQRADGTRLPAVLRGFMSVDPNGRRLVWAMIEDVTEIRAKEAALKAEQDALQATQTRLVTAIEALDDGFAIWDAEDRLVLWNRQYESVFAPIASQIRVGALYDDLLRAAIDAGVFGNAEVRDHESLRRRLDRRLTDTWDGEDELADGRLIWVRERATPARETVGLYEDVTARRLADRRLQQVVDGGEVAVWDWDADRGLSAVNDRWRTMLGLENAGADLPDLLMRLHPDDFAAARDVQKSLFDRGTEQFDLMCRLQHQSGRWIWFLSRGKVLSRRADGRPRRVSGVTLDVTARIDAEQRLSRLIDGAGVGTWEYDGRRAVTIVNDRWAETLGYRAAELNPLPRERLLDMIHPDDRAEIEVRTVRLLAEGANRVENEIRLRHRDGHWVYVLSRGHVIDRDPTGAPLRVTGVHIDISASKALEAELASERDTLARIMETSQSGIIAVDGAGRVVFANAATEHVLGHPVAPGDDLQQICALASIQGLDNTDLAQQDLPLHLALAGRSVPQDVRLSIRWPDGTRRALLVNAARLSATATGIAAVFLVTDITHAVTIEDRLRAAMTAAEAANRAKSDFLAAMSHEMRTPLNGVLGMVEVLDRTLTDKDQAAMLKVIRDSGEHLLSVINDILDLAKIEAGHLDLDPGPIALADVVSRVAAVHRLKADEKGIDLATDCLGSPRDLRRVGDEKRLIQILHNLVGNAIKFTDSGWVSIRLDARDDRRVVIEVADTGIGMSQPEMDRAFEGFTQGQGGIARRFGGTGLGLSIVRRLARMMGGEVTLSGAPGKGMLARVEVILPRLPGEVTPDPSATVQPLPPMRVLVAEDNATNRMILGSMLQGLGVAADICTSGEAALAAWRPDNHAAILLDIAMPGMDGLATLSAFAKSATQRGLVPPPVVAVTANAMTHQVRDYLQRGFTAVVAKPLRPECLAAALWTCLGQVGAVQQPAEGA